MSWYFTSDLHLSHQSILRGWRGRSFQSMEEHNKIITDNLLALPKGSDLMIAGDLFWKFNSKEVEEFFTKFKRAGINIHIVYGNHDKASWFKSSAIKSQGHLKEMVIDKQPITISHYPMKVWNRSHYNAWNLHGHIHMKDSTWKKMENSFMFQTYGKQLNINIELHDYKPWSFEEIKHYMDKQRDNWYRIIK